MQIAIQMFRPNFILLALGWALLQQVHLANAWPTPHQLSQWLPHFKSQRPQTQPDFARRNFETVSRIYNLTVYPNQLPILGGGGAAAPPGLFTQDVRGRVTPVGDFEDFEHSIEYFFSLSPVPQGNAVKGAITGYRIVEFSSQCPEIAASVVYLYCSVVDPGSPDHGRPLPALKQVAFWRFDSQGTVAYYDAWIPNLHSWVELTNGGAPVSDPQFQASSITQICTLTQLRCHGENRQWDSIEQCIADLSQKPYGNYDEAWGDNIACRSIHLVLTQVRPDVHCPHVGPTGGGKCVNAPYAERYFSDESLFGSPSGETFVCK